MKKAIGMFAALILALGMTGVAFAHWSEVLWIEGTVTTGELCLEWSVDIEDNGYKDGYGDVATVNYELVDDDEDGCAEGLRIEVLNAYPSFAIWGTIDIYNCGTVPARFYGISEEYYEMEPADWVCDSIDFSYEFSGDCEQIDPDDKLLLDFSIHFNQNTPENASASFYIALEFVNWNAP